MTKSFFLHLLLCGALAFSSAIAYGQSQQLIIGYGNGDLETDVEMGEPNYPIFLRQAVEFPAGYMKTLAGNRITRVRVPLAMMPSEQDNELFLSHDLSGEPFYTQTIEQLNEGWTDFEDKRYSIRFEDMVQSGRMAPGTDITDFSVFASHPRVDSLYHYDASMNRATPKFTVAFRENYLHMYHETPRHYLAQLRVIGTPYPDNFAGCLLVDKSTLKGAQIEIMADELGGITLPLKQRLQIDYRYFAFCLEPGILLMLLEERLKEKDKMSKGDLAKITELLNSISEDDNNYLLFGEWK